MGNQFNLNNFFKESPLDHWLELKIVENKQEIKSRWKRNKFCFLCFVGFWDNKMLVHDLYESMTSWPVHLFQDQSLRNINYLKTKRFPQVFMFWKSWTRLEKIAREILEQILGGQRMCVVWHFGTGTSMCVSSLVNQ